MFWSFFGGNLENPDIPLIWIIWTATNNLREYGHWRELDFQNIFITLTTGPFEWKLHRKFVLCVILCNTYWKKLNIAKRKIFRFLVLGSGMTSTATRSPLSPARCAKLSKGQTVATTTSATTTSATTTSEATTTTTTTTTRTTANVRPKCTPNRTGPSRAGSTPSGSCPSTRPARDQDYQTSLHWPENTHLLRKGKYHCTADILFDRFGFNQICKSVSNST